jgi:hypothetical protein
MRDWRGVEIEEGATIVYCTRGGSAMGMVEAVVEDIKGNTLTARIVRRQSSYPGIKDVVQLSKSYITVVTLPESTVKTNAELRAEREARIEYFREHGVWPPVV